MFIVSRYGTVIYDILIYGSVKYGTVITLLSILI